MNRLLVVDALSNPNSSTLSAPAEPCPPPLSTLDVFESFEREGRAWAVEAREGTLHGWTLGQGRALYFLNGLEGTSELFRLLAWLLRDEFRCVLFDGVAPSVADSKSISDVSSLPEASQLFAAADWHADERFLIYGTGFGAWTALAAMLSQPDRIRGAVLQGAYAQRQFKLLERLLLFLGKKSQRRFEDMPCWKSVFEQNHRRWFPPFDAPRWELFHHLAGNVPVSEVARRARLLRGVKLRDRLSEITVPILSIKSEGQGRLRLDAQQEMEIALPNCRAEFLKDSGLVPHWTHPHRVAKLIREFAGELSNREQPASSSLKR